MILWVDFETRSRCNLLTKGTYNYAQDLSTDVLCMSYAFDDEDVVTWLPSQPFPENVKNFTGQIRTHNAAFERLIFWYVLQLDFKLEQFYCTAAQARANCLPGSLDDVGRAISSVMRKDHRGNQLIRALSLPRVDGSFNDDPTLMAEMVAYCEQDVRAMRAISKSIRELSTEELRDYHINEHINDTGVQLDVELARAAIKYSDAEVDEIQRLVADITDGEVTSVRSPKMRQWVLDRVGKEALKVMTVYKDDEAKYSIDKTVRANLLALAEEQPDEIPPHVADVIQCADDLWASSVAKFKRLIGLADDDDQRVRGAFVFNGGAATGRASSYGAQVHNFTRKCAKDPEAAREALVNGEAIVPKYGKRVTDVLKGMLRPALIPSRGKVLVVSDWAAIEARCTPWLSCHPSAETILEDFREGRDIYVRAAANIFHINPEDVTDSQRQIGKVAILSCGYGGGAGAFAAMGRNYGVTLPESDAIRTVNAWRRANPWAVDYWRRLETTYTKAMRNRGYEFSIGKIAYLFDGTHLWYVLPSGRVLCYPFAKLEEGGVTYLKAAWKPAVDATEWPRARLWSGLACENITQAVANDVLRNALSQVSAEMPPAWGAKIVLHIHDELVLECQETHADAVKAKLETIMCTPPSWAGDLPLAASTKIMRRYGK
jgi:DNA polymerase